MKVLQSRVFQAAIGFLISIGLVLWLYFAIDWKIVFTEILKGNYWMLIPGLGIMLFQYYLRTVRWACLLPKTSDASARVRFDSLMIGNLATFILPLRAGEFIRPAMLSMQSNLTFPSCFVSIVLERFFDLSVVLLCFGVMIGYVPDVPPWAHKGAFVLFALALCILLFMVCGVLLPKQLSKASDFSVSFLPKKIGDKIANFLKTFLLGAEVLRGRGVLLKTILLSFGVWLSTFVFFYVFMLLFHVEASFWSSVVITVIVALAVAAPSAPGFIGVYQTACVAGFSLSQLSTETGAAFAIITHVFQYVVFVVYGAFILFRYDLSFHEIRKAQS